MQHLIKRGNNAIGQVGPRAVVPMDLEMDALEQFGPLARNALANAPIKILAYPLLMKIYAVRLPDSDSILDPKEPALDAAIANGVMQEATKFLLIDREPIDAYSGVIPLRPRPGARRQR